MRGSIRLLIALFIIGGLYSCASDSSMHTVELPSESRTPNIIGDGLEVRCYGLQSTTESLHRAIIGLGGELRSSHELVLQGMEYYVFPADRVDDFLAIVSDGAAWNVRWHGQQFVWNNILPKRVFYDNGPSKGWLALPARTWSTMMEDGPVVYLETVPSFISEEVGTMTYSPLRHLRSELVLRPGTALILVGGSGRSLEDEIIESRDEEPSKALEATLGQHLLQMRETTLQVSEQPVEVQGNVVIFLPRFTEERQLPPLRTPM